MTQIVISHPTPTNASTHMFTSGFPHIIIPVGRTNQPENTMIRIVIVRVVVVVVVCSPSLVASVPVAALLQDAPT